MRLLERRREFFASEGYLIVKEFFPKEEIAEVVTAQDAFYRGETDSEPEFHWPRPRLCRARSRKHPYASFFCGAIGKLLRDGRLGRLIQQTGELKSVRFWHDQLLYEEAREATPGEIDYHWHREDSRWQTCEASQMVTAWIPLCDFTEEMGPITLDLQGKVKRMVLKAGDLVIFKDNVRHGNPPNFGKQARRALAGHFASGDLRYRKSGRFSHVNERIVQTVDGHPDFRDERVCPLIDS